MTSPRMEDGRKSSGDDEATEAHDSWYPLLTQQGVGIDVDP